MVKFRFKNIDLIFKKLYLKYAVRWFVLFMKVVCKTDIGSYNG